MLCWIIWSFDNKEDWEFKGEVIFWLLMVSCWVISASLEFSIDVVSLTDAVGGWLIEIIVVLLLFPNSSSNNLSFLGVWFSCSISFNLIISSRANNNWCSKLLHSSCKRDLSRCTLSTSAFQSSLSCNLHFFEFSTFNCSA